jgi:hypothetical protein
MDGTLIVIALVLIAAAGFLRLGSKDCFLSLKTAALEASNIFEMS